MDDPNAGLDRPSRILANIPDGLQPAILAREVEARLKEAPEAPVALVYVARDGRRLLRMADILEKMLPGHEVLVFPAWDCLPYDRVSPNAVTLASRMATLARLTDPKTRGAIVLTAVNAYVQRVVPRRVVSAMTFSARASAMVDSDRLIAWASDNGYLRVPTVREAGEYAVRGGLIDLYPAGRDAPLRFDFFGQQLETIRSFDPESQRTTGNVKQVTLVPMSEAMLTEDSIRRFRRNYTTMFGGNTADDPLYGAISAGQRFAGMEHWLPFFHEEMERLADYAGEAPFYFDEQAAEALGERRDQIADYYDARQQARESGQGGGAPYKPIPPELLYHMDEPVYALVRGHEVSEMTPFMPADASLPVIDCGGRLAPNFAAERQASDTNVFEAVISTIKSQARGGKKTLVTCWSEGTRDRMGQVLADHGLKAVKALPNWKAIESLKVGQLGLVVLPLESGFVTDELFVLSEQDILGERIIRASRKKKGAEAITEATSLSAGDLVVHVDHGIGRFLGLKAIEAAGAPHDCVEIEYARGDKLYLPVENIELLSRYGSDQGTELDRLGGVAWQAKKARLKQRIRDMAAQLIKIAAAREMASTAPITIPMGSYDEFCARFPYEETEDQLATIDAIFTDLTSGRIMDRLVCGDVGFGKTEVALRAAFAVAMAGQQVAVVVPTTLLSRQHFKTFSERFAGLPINVRQASRLVSAAELKATKEGLKDGSVDIVVGTHALLAKSVEFRDLGLLIVDEEQHFGVGHKERLKDLKHNVHVLTLTATPIPRTLQLALTGVRDLSLLATPPVDRLAIRTFVSPFDPLVVREALLREKYRGGQAFYVCPRISDQSAIAEFLAEQVPEVSFVVANGQMAPGQLDDTMNAFYDGKFDVLVATTIVESGLDIPTANTLIVHRADKFGLAQLYQIRGRIGRSKTRAYAIFTVPADRKLNDQAQRRLQVLQSLESLGAGFQLASHDLDIRGAGNLLGEEQSGHIREVGFELYQSMLEEAVVSLRAGETEEQQESGAWSPQISLGMPVMIPESYVPDLQVRMQLYRRLGDLSEAREIDAFGAELIDRFGPLPGEVESLLKVVLVKSLCRTANVEKVEAGPKGALVTLRNNIFPNPAGLVRLIGDPAMAAKLRPDQKIMFARSWPGEEQRLKGSAAILSRLAGLAQEVAAVH